MAGASLLALIDDIASVLDDVALLTKTAAAKTSGVVGDDLAVNAQQVAGVAADRELPVVWAVAKGSLVNKGILVPAALAISAWIPWAVTPLLILGGLFLCYEGFEKVAHRHAGGSGHGSGGSHARRAGAADPAAHAADLGAFERSRIKGAIRTDFILSAEIIAITLGTVATASFTVRATVLVGIALVMTVGVYGLVAAIVKLDDAGLHLAGARGDGIAGRLARALGARIVGMAPPLMRGLAVAGTIAMFLVGGSIIDHGLPPLHAASAFVGLAAGAIPAIGGIAATLAPLVVDVAIGFIAGGLVYAAAALFRSVSTRATSP